MPLTDHEALKAYQREWARKDRAAHPEKYAERKRRAYARKRDQILDAAKSYHHENREKVCAAKKARYRSQEPNVRRDKSLQRLYGITLAQFSAMYAAQDGLCAICRELEAVHVDHCHATGKVRGLLCSCCNTGIGQLKECRNILLNAINYLDHYSTSFTKAA